MKMVKKANNQFFLINTFNLNLSNGGVAIGDVLHYLLFLPPCNLSLVPPLAMQFNRRLP
jgi:hypothetical protein